MLPVCSAADILAAYNDWVGGFGYDGRCDVTDNIASVPALGTPTCGGQLSFTYTATSGQDGCQDMASCNATLYRSGSRRFDRGLRRAPMLPV